MRQFTFLILVVALATTSAFAAQKYRYYGSSGSKSYQAASNPSKPKVSTDEKKAAEEEGLDIRKMTQRLQSESKK